MKTRIENFLSVFIVLSSMFFSCNSKAQDSIHISFKIDDEIQNISDNFKIYFINQDDTSQAKIDKEIAYIPTLKDSLYTVVFLYENQKLNFDSIPKSMILPADGTGWNFGIENRLFNPTRGLLSTEDYKNDTLLKEIYYLQFSPPDLDGIQIVKKRY